MKMILTSIESVPLLMTNFQRQFFKLMSFSPEIPIS